MQILRALHTALEVSDLDRAHHFYGTVLGLPAVERALNFPGQWYQVGDWQLHLILAPRVTQPLDPGIKWGRHRHLAFAVGDLAAVQEQLQAHGCPLQPSASGRAALFTQDPDGNVVELTLMP